MCKGINKNIMKLMIWLKWSFGQINSSLCLETEHDSHILICTVPLETMGPFAAILPRSNRGFYLQFHLGKTPSNRIEKLGFT